MSKRLIREERWVVRDVPWRVATHDTREGAQAIVDSLAEAGVLNARIVHEVRHVTEWVECAGEDE